MSISETIAAFSGAISPYSIQLATYEPNYDIATQHYANLQFGEAITKLTESIDINGISPRTLNLLGASYRLADKPNLALPYLILCFRMDPNTPYLIGNIVLCLNQMKYTNIEQAVDFLLQYAKDSWSQEQLKTIKH
jgi:tetratricopeptide (TPR) repeat protein